MYFTFEKNTKEPRWTVSTALRQLCQIRWSLIMTKAEQAAYKLSTLVWRIFQARCHHVWNTNEVYFKLMYLPVWWKSRDNIAKYK